MSEREIRSYDYVNHPYGIVRDVLSTDPQGVFRAATMAAATRAESVAAELRVNIGGLHVAAEIVTSVGKITETGSAEQGTQVTRIPIEWEAAHRPLWFPFMSGVLSVYRITATETQLDFVGIYEPPLGKVGGALDAMVGHKIAEASVHRFVEDVAVFLRKNLA
jgi:hypothetical protein